MRVQGRRTENAEKVAVSQKTVPMCTANMSGPGRAHGLDSQIRKGSFTNISKISNLPNFAVCYPVLSVI